MRRISVFEIARASVNALEHLSDHKQQRLELINNCHDDVISGNRSEMIRVINNLLSNAIKFTPQNGQVRLSIEEGPSGHLRIMVTDTGIGIPEEKIPHLFDRYTNSHTGTSGEKGAGLGLSIVKEIVKKHGGTLKVTSKERQGACFELILPKAPAETRSAAKKIEKAQAISEQAEPTPAGIYKILLAEDNADNILLAKRILTRAGHLVTVAENARLAVEAAQKDHFDIILMDMQMPEMDGYEAIKQIRNWERSMPNQQDFERSALRIPIVALTAQNITGDRERCIQTGADGYLSKPYKSKQLLETIKKHIPVSTATESKAIYQDSPNNGSVFNKSELMDRVDGDEDFYKELIGIFLKEIPSQLEGLKKAIEDNEPDIAERHAHTIKGSSANIAAPALTDAASEMEKTARNGDLSQTGALLNRLKSEFERLRTALETFP